MLIGKDWKLETDSLNIVLFQRRISDPDHHCTKGVSAERWEAIGYFRTIKDALHEMVNLEINEVGLGDLWRLEAKVSTLHQDIECLFGSLQQSPGQPKLQTSIKVPAKRERVKNE